LAIVAFFLGAIAAGMPVESANAQDAAPAFSKAFSPGTIGPGSIATLTFTIDNSAGPAPVTDLAFTDILPAGITLADAPNAVTNCVDGIVTLGDAPDTISLTGGGVGAFQTCTVSVYVIGTATATNVSGDLISTDGNSGTANATLTVSTDLPGFSKSFAPATVGLGERSTLTFTIDNTANGSGVAPLAFTDTLPPGMTIATPANASTNCENPSLPATLTAPAGGSVITLFAFGLLPSFPVLGAGAACTVTVDVIGGAVGTLANVSGELTASSVNAGKATAALEVTVGRLNLTKSFTNDPVPPGGTATLAFTINNFDRNSSATGVAFDDSLPAGLTFSSLVSDDCGGTLDTSTPSLLSYSGGTLGPEGSCTIGVSLSVPAGATPSTYTNTTGTVSGTVDGVGVVGNTASDDLIVGPVPLLTKEFTSDPVGPGGNVTLEFSITNQSTTAAATDIDFTDVLSSIPGVTNIILGNQTDICGLGDVVFVPSGPATDATIILTGGTLGPAGVCTFSVSFELPLGISSGVYTNTTEEITATVDGATRTGRPASDTLTVVAAPHLSKSFSDDPVAPGGTVTLEFTLSHSANASTDATGITFTDDLSAVLAGLTASLPLVPDPPCGAGSALTGSAGDTLLTLAGGTLAPGAECTFSVTLDVPAGAAVGSHANTTSGVSATVDGLAATSPAASDDLVVTGLIFSKEFIDDPVVAGDAATLRFTFENVHPTDDATGITFSDSLSTILPGTPDVEVVSFPATPCGGTLTSVIPTSLSFAGGSVDAGTSCSFDVTVEVPAGTADGTYTNVTSALSSSFGTSAAASDGLIVNSTLLQITKEFTDDPAVPGGAVALSFNITNLSATGMVADIAFSDDLDAALSGLEAISAAANTCGGMADALPASTFSYAGGTLGPGATCTITLNLTVPGGALSGAFANTTSDVTGTIGGFAVKGDPATDDLAIISATTPNLQKSFTPDTISVDGTVNLTFTITNPAAGAALSDLSFTDDLATLVPAIGGLTASLPPVPDPPCGAGSSLTVSAGDTLLTFAGGNLAAGASCQFTVPVKVPLAAPTGTFSNTTSSLRGGDGAVEVAGPAVDTLTIREAGFGTVGVAVTGTSSGVNCINNKIANFATPTSGCEVEVGTNPPAP
jgi:uncharacterized repeat protein (TIGR01451 family)